MSQRQKTELESLREKIIQKVIKDPKKTGQILTEWIKKPAQKKPLKKAG